MNILGKPVAIGGGAGWELAPESWATGLVDRTISGSVYGSMVLSVRESAFYRCSLLTGVEFPNCLSIGSYAFRGCVALETASFPKCMVIGTSAFAPVSSYVGYLSKLTTVNFQNCSFINACAFYNCSNLATANFPACKSIGQSAFAGCGKLNTINFPACESVDESAFYNCSTLTEVEFPACHFLYNAFWYCRNLSVISLPTCVSLAGSPFEYCNRLTSLYLIGSKVCTLSRSGAFYSTPIGGYSASAGKFGSIYVPASLLALYQAATNWTYFSSRFVGV